MNRRKFLKISCLAAGTVVTGGAIFIMSREPDILDPFVKATRKVFVARYGDDRAQALVKNTLEEYESLKPDIPYIGGKNNIFSQWLIYGAYYMALYRILKARDHSIEEVGKMIYDTYETMGDYPNWFLRIVGSFKYGKRSEKKLKSAAAESQKRRYPGDWVCTYIAGNGSDFDYGLDVSKCGIKNFYQAHGADELTPYLCLSDYVVSEVFGRGLVRHKTLAEGADKCDFRYKKGRPTYVSPLRDGWPPKFQTNTLS